jgi:hypothetical protein
MNRLATAAHKSPDDLRLLFDAQTVKEADGCLGWSAAEGSADLLDLPRSNGLPQRGGFFKLLQQHGNRRGAPSAARFNKPTTQPFSWPEFVDVLICERVERATQRGLSWGGRDRPHGRQRRVAGRFRGAVEEPSLEYGP